MVKKYIGYLMEIQGRHLLRDFSKNYAHARKPLDKWVEIVERVTWKTPNDIKVIFADVSFVKTTTIFNIGGNKYRLLSHVLYQKRKVVIYSILTHEQYDKLTIT